MNKKFAAEHPDTVKALLNGHAEVRGLAQRAPAADKADVLNAALKESAGAALSADVIDRSLQNIVFTVDPLAGTYPKLLQDGVDAGTTKQADITGIFDLTALNERHQRGRPERTSPPRASARTNPLPPPTPPPYQ